MENFKENIDFWIDFLTDKKYSIRFKICNIIMGDYLRNIIAFSRLNAKSILENADTYAEVPEAQAKLAVLKAKQMYKWLGDVMS